MDIDYENYDLKNPFDRIRLEEDRIKRAIAIGKARKARDKHLALNLDNLICHFFDI